MVSFKELNHLLEVLQMNTGLSTNRGASYFSVKVVSKRNNWQPLLEYHLAIYL